MEIFLQFLIITSSGIAINGHNTYNKEGNSKDQPREYNPLGAMVR